MFHITEMYKEAIYNYLFRREKYVEFEIKRSHQADQAVQDSCRGESCHFEGICSYKKRLQGKQKALIVR